MTSYEENVDQKEVVYAKKKQKEGLNYYCKAIYVIYTVGINHLYLNACKFNKVKIN